MLTHLVATDFASSPAGWLTGVGTPSLTVLIGALWKAISGRLKQQDADNAIVQNALVEANRTLAVMLADSGHVSGQVQANTTKIAELAETTAVLKAWREDYIRAALPPPVSAAPFQPAAPGVGG